jgi:hypothetical protein
MSSQVQCPNCGGFRVSMQDQGWSGVLIFTIFLGGWWGLLGCGALLLTLEDIVDTIQSGMFFAALLGLLIGWGPIILVSSRRKPYLLKCDLCGKEWDQRETIINLNEEPSSLPAYEEEIKELVRRGRKIDAIKVYRQHTKAGLRDAKRFIEEIEKNL